MAAEAQRLNRYLAACGLGSRRGVETLVAEGRVTIDGVVADSPGQRVEDGATVEVDGARVAPDAHAYVLLNKPKDVVTTVRDTHGRRTVIELVGADRRLFPVGRLDAETTGLLLLTNDGDFTNYVTAARNRVEKVYEVKVKGVPPEGAIQRLRRGIVLEDGTRTSPAKITLLSETQTNAWYEVSLHQGRNQQVRRMFELIGHSVLKLRRVRIGYLTDEGLKPAHYRLLSPAEAARLMKPPKQNRGKRT